MTAEDRDPTINATATDCSECGAKPGTRHADSCSQREAGAEANATREELSDEQGEATGASPGQADEPTTPA